MNQDDVNILIDNIKAIKLELNNIKMLLGAEDIDLVDIELDTIESRIDLMLLALNKR